MSNPLQRAWHFWIGEPLFWLCQILFQPKQFAQTFDARYKQRSQRLRAISRCLLLIMFINSLILLISHVILAHLHVATLHLDGFLLNVTIGSVLILAGALGLLILGGTRGESGMLHTFSLSLILTVSIAFCVSFSLPSNLAGLIVLGLVFGLADGLAASVWGDVVHSFLGIALFMVVYFVAYALALAISRDLRASMDENTIDYVFYTAYLVSGLIGYFRVILIPFSISSALNLYRASHQQPKRVFEYLHHSALYRDELGYILPLLKQTLLLAHDVSPEKAQQELAFIVRERPRQLWVVRAVTLELVFRDLEARTSLAMIAEAEYRLASMLPMGSPLTKRQNYLKAPDKKKEKYQRWVTSFAKLSEASHDAARAIAPYGFIVQRQALFDLQTHLQQVQPQRAFHRSHLKRRLARVVEIWHNAAQEKLALLKIVEQDGGNSESLY